MSVRTQLYFSMAILASLLLCALLYSQGLAGAFVIDDTVSLLALNHNGGVTNFDNLKYFVFGNTSGPAGRPLAMLSFLINDQYYPGDVSSYRHTNLMIHLLCGVGIFVFVSLLMRLLKETRFLSYQIALLVTTIWLVSPLNVSSVLYVVQRMNQLSMLFSLVGLICYLTGRIQLEKTRWKGLTWIFIGLYGCGVLAVLSKENGALIFVYAALCEWLLKIKTDKKSDPWVWAFILAPIALMVGYFLYRSGGWFSQYAGREFTPIARVLTETRILVDYLFRGVFFRTHGLGLIHDDIEISRSLLQPWTTLVACLFHLTASALAVIYRRRFPILLFGLAWFYGGHLMESTVLPLELYFEHRNYMPIVGIYIALIVTLVKSLTRSSIKFGLLTLWISLGCYGTWQQAILWGDPYKQRIAWFEEHPDSLRAQTLYVKSILQRRDFRSAAFQLAEMKSRWPNTIHIDLIMLNLTCLNHLRMRSPENILELAENARFTLTLTTEVEHLKNHAARGTCPELLDPIFHPLMNKLIALDRLPGETRASYAYWQSEVYIAEGNLSGMVASLEASVKYHRDSIPLYVASRNLANAGLLAEALHFIDRAIEFEQAGKVVRNTNLTAYKAFKQRLLKAIEQQNNSRFP